MWAEWTQGVCVLLIHHVVCRQVDFQRPGIPSLRDARIEECNSCWINLPTVAALVFIILHLLEMRLYCSPLFRLDTNQDFVIIPGLMYWHEFMGQLEKLRWLNHQRRVHSWLSTWLRIALLTELSWHRKGLAHCPVKCPNASQGFSNQWIKNIG